MCGISGIYDMGASPVDVLVQKSMNEVLRHRGPDDEGLVLLKPLEAGAPPYVSYGREEISQLGKGGAAARYRLAMGQTRLSIIDLSKNAHQPMSNEDDTLWVTFNGEIYNYLELRGELVAAGHTFKSTSDTEVILHAYEEYGTECLKRFNGMFAFALWDGRRELLFLARDHLGIKPLYYTERNGTFVFASELKAIIQLPGMPRVADRRTIFDYWHNFYVVGDRSWFKGISRLMPGYFMVVEDGKLRTERFWDVKFEHSDESFEQSRIRLRELLEDSVRLQLRSDVPLGSHLSGGMDSSSVATLAARRLDHPLMTFSGYFEELPEMDERVYIHRVSGRYKTEHYETQPKVEGFRETFSHLVWLMEEPMVSDTYPPYCVSVLARARGAKVVLGGCGGDELFGGYPRHFLGYFISLATRRKSLPEWWALAQEVLHIPGYLKIAGGLEKIMDRLIYRNKALANVTAGIFASEFMEEVRAAKTNMDYMNVPKNKYDAMLYWDIKNYIPGLLHMEDRMSMVVGLEARVPLLDYRIVEFAATLPELFKVRRGTTKYIFRRAMEDILPKEIINRKDKKGFPKPTYNWLFGSERKWADEKIAEAAPVMERVFSGDFLRFIREVERGKPVVRGYDYWRMINIAEWFKVFNAKLD